MSDRRDVLNLVPMWFRSRWPLRHFYWQDEDIKAVKARAEQLARDLGWGP